MRYKYLLDTDICIYIAKSHPENVCKAKALMTLQRLTNAIAVLDLDDSVANAYGNIRSELEREGRVIGSNEHWIPAHAFTLVTNNTREYNRISKLSVENWVN